MLFPVVLFGLYIMLFCVLIACYHVFCVSFLGFRAWWTWWWTASIVSICTPAPLTSLSLLEGAGRGKAGKASSTLSINYWVSRNGNHTLTLITLKLHHNTWLARKQLTMAPENNYLTKYDHLGWYLAMEIALPQAVNEGKWMRLNVLRCDCYYLRSLCLAFLSRVSDQGEPQKLCPVLLLTGLAGGEAGANGGLHRCVDIWGTCRQSLTELILCIMLQGITLILIRVKLLISLVLLSLSTQPVGTVRLTHWALIVKAASCYLLAQKIVRLDQCLKQSEKGTFSSIYLWSYIDRHHSWSPWAAYINPWCWPCGL